MAGFRFNIRQRNVKNGKNGGDAAKAEDQTTAALDTPDRPASLSADLVACIPCPALVVDDNRKISALNDPFCDAFGVQTGYFPIGEEFADFARRMSLSGSTGLLAIGDFLTGDKPPRDIEIVARNGAIFEARACRTADARTLITFRDPTPSDDSDLARYSRDVVRNMPGPALSLVRHPDGLLQCLNANNQALELLERGLRELTASAFDFRSLVTDRHRHDFEVGIERCSTLSEPFDMEFQVRTETSGLRWIRGLATASRGANGSVVIYLRVVDVEERRRVTAERQQLQQLLDTVIDNIPLMVNVKKADDYRFVLVNKAFEDMTSTTRTKILGKRDYKPFPDWDCANRREWSDRVLKSNNPVSLPETTFETQGKGTRILKTRKFPMTGPSGAIDYILSITEDVTEHRNAENALRNSEQRLRDAIESLSDGLALFDTEERLVMCNDRYRTIWPGLEDAAGPGSTLESLVRRYRELANAGDSKQDIDYVVQNILNRIRMSRSSHEFEIFDGRWIQVSNHPIADGGFAITCTDITALKEREESLRKASRQAILAKETAEVANRSKTDFLANMSHELRTPLNAVIGFSEIIKEGLLGNHNIEPYQGYAQDIHDSGTHLLSLINDILDMSKIEAGKLELFEEEVDLNDAIEASLRLVKERAHQNKVSLQTEIPDDLPRLTCDLRKFKQIAINILSNAVKFTPERGKVTARVFMGDDGDLYLQIADTGIGINQDDLEKVLEPFGQADHGLNRQFEGTGLGLTLTRSLVELHGGRLEIESETEGDSTGTTVTAVFPASRIV